MSSSRRQFLAGSIAAMGVPLYARGALAQTAGEWKLTPLDGQVQTFLCRLTLAENVWQVAQANQSYLHDLDDLQKYHLGPLLSGSETGTPLRCPFDFDSCYCLTHDKASYSQVCSRCHPLTLTKTRD